MAFKLTKDEKNQRDALIETLRAAQTKIEEAEAEFNERLEELLQPLKDAVEAYNEVVETAREFVEETGDRLREEFDEKSERWMEGGRGSVVQDFISVWDSLYIYAIDAPDVDPVAICDDMVQLADELEGLPDSPD